MWEDDANKYGGRWVINMGRGSKLELDKLWLDVVSILGLCVRWLSHLLQLHNLFSDHWQLLILIGEAFEHTEEVCGAVINLRGKSNKICEYT